MVFGSPYIINNNKSAMNQASQYLLELAKQKIKPYIANPQTRAAMITGSTATGQADFYSDVEMFIYYEHLPPKEELQFARQQNQGSEPILTIDDYSNGWFGESYYIDGVEFQIGCLTVAFWERDMARILQQLYTSPLQKALSGMLDCIPLYGEDLISQWKKQVANYPDSLARAMVEKYLNFVPIWALQEELAVRDTTLFQHQIRLEAGQNILGILAGLNRLYYTTFQLKRMKKFIEKMNIAPQNLYERLEAIFHQAPLSTTSQLKELVSETVELVELNMPEIDTSKVKKSLVKKQHSWEPKPIEENK